MDAFERRPRKLERTIQMVVFDVEGIILPTQRYLLQEVTLLNNRKKLAVLFNGLLYQIGIRHLRKTLELIYRNFEGIPFEDFARIFEKIQLIPGTDEVFSELRKRNVSIALISSGIPEQFVQKLAKKLGVDYAIGPKLEVENGKLTGKIFGDIIDTYGKRMALTGILEKASIPPSACAVIADDRNNIPMFEPGILRIGFNPDFALTAKSDFVVRGDLKEVLGILFKESRLNMPTTRRGMGYIRETIHIGSVLVPFICQFLGFNRFILSTIILLTAVGYFLGEATRFLGHSLPPFTTLTRLAATGSERWDFATSPLYFAAGVILCLTFFPTPSGYVGITVVTAGDAVAKIIGRRWGRNLIPFNKPKTVEGTLVGLAVSALIASLYVNPIKALLAASLGMFVETIPTPVNDNLLIPLVASFSVLIPL